MTEPKTTPTPITDALCTFLVTQFPATVGNIQLDHMLRDLQIAERELTEARSELARAKEELNWQNHRNSGHPTKGGFEFYINEEWGGLARAAIDTECDWSCRLRKNRIDCDDERVRVRRVAEDDTILRELAAMTKERDAWRECADELYKSCKHIGYTSCGEGHIIQRAERAVCAFEMLDNLTPPSAPDGPSSSGTPSSPA